MTCQNGNNKGEQDEEAIRRFREQIRREMLEEIKKKIKMTSKKYRITKSKLESIGRK